VPAHPPRAIDELVRLLDRQTEHLEKLEALSELQFRWNGEEEPAAIESVVREREEIVGVMQRVDDQIAVVRRALEMSGDAVVVDRLAEREAAVLKLAERIAARDAVVGGRLRERAQKIGQELAQLSAGSTAADAYARQIGAKPGGARLQDREI